MAHVLAMELGLHLSVCVCVTVTHALAFCEILNLGSPSILATNLGKSPNDGTQKERGTTHMLPILTRTILKLKNLVTARALSPSVIYNH